jgi:hypothetical protein
MPKYCILYTQDTAVIFLTPSFIHVRVSLTFSLSLVRLAFLSLLGFFLYQSSTVQVLYNKWWGLGGVCTCYDATTSCN